MLNGLNSVGFFDEKAQRIDIHDKRFYYSPKRDKYFVNLTTVIKAGGPTSPHLIDWYKKVGLNADQILKEAGEIGSIVHEMIDNNIKGHDISWVSDGKTVYKREVWEMFLRFVQFRDTFKPFVYANEIIVISEDLNVGMTIDLVCRIGDENWIIDFKSSNYINEDYFIQVAVAAKAWNEYFFRQVPIHRVGLLHLKAETRGEDKKGKKMQGKGWQVVEPPMDWENYIPKFRRRMEEWAENNPNYKPSNYSLPTLIQGYKNHAPVVMQGQADNYIPKG